MGLLDWVFGTKKDSYDILCEGVNPSDALNMLSGLASSREKLNFEIPNTQKTNAVVDILIISDRETAMVFDGKGRVFYTAVGGENHVDLGNWEVWRKAVESNNEGNVIYAVHTHPNDAGASYVDFVANESIIKATGVAPFNIIVTPSKVYYYVPGETGYGGVRPNRGPGWYERHGLKPGDDHTEPKWFMEKAYSEYGKKNGLFDARSPGDEMEFYKRWDATIRDIGLRLGFEVHEYNRSAVLGQDN